MAETPPEHRDEDSNLTRRGLLARQQRANLLKGNRQARADLNARWEAAGRHDSTGIPTVTDAAMEADRAPDR